MTKLEGMTNYQIMAKRFDVLTLQRFKASTLQDLSIHHSTFGFHSSFVIRHSPIEP
jgi:hypothetical protein